MDGVTQTVRNTPIMVDFGLPGEVPRLRHFDGEFASAEDVVMDTLTGRNMGWRFNEYALAIAHIAHVIRNDAGKNARRVRDRDGRGIPYSVVMLGTDSALPPDLRIPRRYRLDVRTASDAEVLQAIARLIHAYMDSIRFGTEDTSRPRGSPYDLFLERNKLPTKPDPGELSGDYVRRLRALIEQRRKFVWITPQADGEFQLHAQAYEFGATELAGLKLFFGRAGPSQPGPKGGNCIACHPPPQFTDYRFHNTGVSQAQYDALFGAGSFARLNVPTLSQRNIQPDVYLPATRQHPNATSRYRSAPSKERPGYADLGVWNIFANPDFPKPQPALIEILCSSAIPAGTSCTPDAVLPFTVALFKTPSLRDLGHSEPYFHSGAANTIEDALVFYSQTLQLERSGQLRNGSPELRDSRFTRSDIRPLAAFLRSLNEDYH
jgi:hypothetical protein